MRTCLRTARALAPLATLLLAATVALPAAAAAPKQTQFPSPAAAAQALVDAMKARDTKGMLAMLGAEAKPLIDSGDRVADEASWDRFVQSYETAHALVKRTDGSVEVQTGTDQWPLPIPLVEADGAWHFDTAAGKQEILDRRVGRNELSTIQTALAYVDAQREYAQRNPQDAALPEYARQFISTPGKRDGLFWQAPATEEASPLGELFARARSEGYRKGKAAKPVPYHGYYYRILTAQGGAAVGGAYDYIVNGKMIGGFALVAYPAEYASSGVMTFLVNHDGVVFEKDLGPDTVNIAKRMTAFNPDDMWTKLSPN